MSSIVAAFNPATANSTEFTAPQSSANGALVFFNESNISLNLTFADGSTMYLPAWYHRHKCGASGSVNVQWVARTVLNSGPPPTSEVIVEAFRSGEAFPADGPLVRQANGEVNSTVTATNQLSNTGNPPGTNVINVQPSDAASPTITLDNEGNLTIKGDVAGVLTQLLQIVANASANSDNVVLSDSTHRAHILGGLQVEGGLTVVSSGSGIGAGPGVFINGNFNTNNGAFIIGGFTIVAKGSDTQVCAPNSTNFIRFDFPAGTTAAHVANDGYHLDGTSKYSFLVGTLSRQNGSQIACGSGTVISHGLGVTPAFVLAVCNIAQPGSATVGVGSVGSSTFTATITAGSQIDWWAAAG